MREPRKAPVVLKTKWIKHPSFKQITPNNRVDLIKEYGKELQLLNLHQDRAWVVDSPGKWIVWIKGEGALHFYLKRGAITDFNSVPPILESFEKKDDRRSYMAALSHDILYATHIFSKIFADELFYAIMRSEGTPYFQAKYKYWAVKYFGRHAWDNQETDYEIRWFNILWLDTPLPKEGVAQAA